MSSVNEYVWLLKMPLECEGKGAHSVRSFGYRNESQESRQQAGAVGNRLKKRGDVEKLVDKE